MLRAERFAPANVAPAPAPNSPGASPLTHHEILRLAEPFSRAGRNVDLPASDRLARRLAFRPRSHACTGAMPAGDEDLLLDAAGSGWFALHRSVHPTRVPAEGAVATLQAEGASPAALLAWVDAVPAARQWQQAAGVTIVLGHKLQAAGRAQTEPVMTLVRAAANLAGLTIVMTVSRVKNVPAELQLSPVKRDGGDGLTQSSPAALPEDLLAVLGLDWSRLTRHSGGWRASLRLRGDGAARGLDGEAKFRCTIEHLARVLCAPPAAFHDAYRGARWRVTLRRSFPLLVCLLVIGAAAAVPLLELGPGSVYRMLIFNAPPLLMVWLFAMRELPRIEIPPLPRRLLADAWVPLSAPASRLDRDESAP